MWDKVHKTSQLSKIEWLEDVATLDRESNTRGVIWFKGRKLSALAAEMQYLQGEPFDGDLFLLQYHRRLDEFGVWFEDKLTDVLKHKVFGNDKNSEELKECNKLLKAANDHPLFSPKRFEALRAATECANEDTPRPTPLKDERAQRRSRRLVSAKWNRYAAILSVWQDMVKEGAFKLFPRGMPRAAYPAGSGAYRLSRTHSKCYFTRRVPVHACVPCADGLIQPWPIALDTGFWSPKLRDEGQCTTCPAVPDLTRELTAGTGSLGAVNFFLVSAVTHLYLDWGHVWHADDLSGLKLYSFSLGSVPGGAQYQTLTPMRPPLATSLVLGPAHIATLGLQPGAPVFVTVQAEDVAGNIATYADTNPVVWDPNGPLPGDIKDGSLDDYRPPVAQTASAQAQNSAAGARRLSSSATTLQKMDGDEENQLEETTDGADAHASAPWLSVYPVRNGRRLQFGALPSVNASSTPYDWTVDSTLTDITYVPDLDHWTDPTRLEVTYEAFSSNAAGVAAMSVCVGSQPYSCDVEAARAADVDPSSITARTLVIDALRLAVPSTVYVTLTAVSGSGLLATVTTDGIRVDNRRPFALPSLRVTDTGRYSLLPEGILGAGTAAQVRSPPVDINCDAAYAGVGASWTGFVAPSGVSRYDWCVGTVPMAGSCGILPWTSVGLATAVYNATLQLPEGTVYYVSVRVVDKAGRMLSSMSDGVRVLEGDMPSTLDANATSEAGIANDEDTVSFNATDAPAGLGRVNATSVRLPIEGRGPSRERFLCDASPIAMAQLSSTDSSDTAWARRTGAASTSTPEGWSSVLTAFD